MTESRRSGPSGAQKFPERDWKLFRTVHANALERYCSRVLQECRSTIENPTLTAQERYVRLYSSLRERDKEVAATFDDVRRSTALLVLVMMIRLDVITAEELGQFTRDVRQRAVELANL